MQYEKLAMKRGRGPYNLVVTFGPYRTVIRAPKKSDAPGGNIPVNAETSFRGKYMASFYGVIVSDILRLDDLHIAEDSLGLPREKKKEYGKACDVLMASLELPLRARGIKTFRGHTHESLARFLQKMGYELTPLGSGRFEVKKDISSKGTMLPFRIRRIEKKERPRVQRQSRPRARKRL